MNANEMNVKTDIYISGNIATPHHSNLEGFTQAAFNKANSAYILAQNAYDQANTGGTGGGTYSSNNFLIYHFPIEDYGLITDPFYSALDEMIGYTYDMKTMPSETHGLINLDAGYV
jgi:hypothetical protein